MPDLKIKCLISGKQTDGKIAVFEEIVDSGIGPPRHTHRNQLEIFHIIEGTIRFEVDGETFLRSAGSTAVVPPGTVHAFRNDEEQSALIHFEMIPANNSEEAFDRLISEEITDVEAFFNQYDIDLSGPPLD